MTNSDIEIFNETLNGGIKGFLAKADKMQNHVKRLQEVALRMASNRQSVRIEAGFMDDDDKDLIKILDELEEETVKNLKALCKSVRGTAAATKTQINAGATMRLSVDDSAPISGAGRS